MVEKWFQCTTLKSNILLFTIIKRKFIMMEVTQTLLLLLFLRRPIKPLDFQGQCKLGFKMYVKVLM